MKHICFTLILALALSWMVPASGFSQNAAQPLASQVRTPPQSSPERRALLDAVRAKLNIKSRFQVTHLMSNGRTAFLEGTEVVEAEGELQETDLSVLALLERKSSAGKERWEVVDIWTLHMTKESARKDFVARLRKRVSAGTLSRSLLPDNLLDEDGE